MERDRGITVKAQTASMIFHDERDGVDYLVNLIDTPGHIDFSYEVSRSLASCQGALLLVDSSQRIQAQTLSNYEKAKNLGLKLIPVVTKIDLPAAQPEDCALNMATTFDVDPEDCIMTSAKKNIGVLEVMQAVIDRLPSPVEASKQPDGPFYGRIVDSWFDECRGVVSLVQVIGGEIREGQRITTYASSKETKDIDNRSDFSVQEIGILTPRTLRTTSLRTGQVAWDICVLYVHYTSMLSFVIRLATSLQACDPRDKLALVIRCISRRNGQDKLWQLQVTIERLERLCLCPDTSRLSRCCSPRFSLLILGIWNHFLRL